MGLIVVFVMCVASQEVVLMVVRAMVWCAWAAMKSMGGVMVAVILRAADRLIEALEAFGVVLATGVLDEVMVDVGLVRVVMALATVLAWLAVMSGWLG